MNMTTLKTSVAALAISGCATEGVPTPIEASDAGFPASGKEDAGAARRGPSGQTDAGIFLPADAVTTDGAVTGLSVDAVATGDSSFALGHDARVSDLLAIVICTALTLAGCDGGGGDLVPDAGLLDTQADVLRTDVLAPAPDTGKTDIDNGGYTPNGVTANLGVNPCQNTVQHPECDLAVTVGCGWDPATNKCYPVGGNVITNFICDSTKMCSMATYQPGTVLIWKPTDARYTYLGDSSGGYVCLPNSEIWHLSQCPLKCDPVHGYPAGCTN
jgi:hypothetical protein